MAKLTASVAVLLTVIGSVVASPCTELEPTRITLHMRPGEFFGNSTIPDSCTGDETLNCNEISINPLTDGDYGDTSNGVNSSQFIAWRERSRITLARQGSNTLMSVRSVNLYFYHDRSLGVGLPEFNLSGSMFESDTGPIVPYTILGNQDLAAGDAQIRNVTLVLTESIAVEATRFHIAFSLMSGVRQFALSEVELCSNQDPTDTETLALEQTSEPGELLNGSIVLVPANRTGLDGDSVIRLSCTVVNQGRFQWVWTAPVSFTQLLLDGTRTSMIEVPQSGGSVGEYFCSASYQSVTPPSTATANFTVEVELVLYPNMRIVSLEGSLVLLECILAGEMLGAEKIRWSFNGQILMNSGKYTIFASNNIVCIYGTCHQSQLQIRQANVNDIGTYKCTYADLLGEITVMNATTTPPIPPSDTPNTTSPTSNSGPTTTATVQPTSPPDLPIPIIAGAAAGGVGAILIVIILIVICCCCNSRTSMMTTNIPHSNGNAYSDDESDALYQVIPKKEIPPPLPSRPPPGSYATVDSNNNGHIELANMTSGPALRDSVISMPAELGGPFSDHTLAKLSVAANGQGLNLRCNPLYSSAGNLIAAAPNPPEKRSTSTPGILDDDGALNIYAIPNKPPPLPERMVFPELKEVSPDPIYTEAGLSPTQFQQSPSLSPSQFQATPPSTTGSPDGSTKICPYASIYADPRPLRREEGPIEVRPYHTNEVRPLGTGQFGEVMLAETRGLSLSDLKLGDSTDKSVVVQVAVKRLKHNADKMVKEAFEKEIKFMARLNHMNVIRMLAICPTGQPFILMEYMEFGDLNQYLQKYEVASSDIKPADNQISVSSLLYACVQISNGMRYLASLHFIHRDLATRNFLVGKDHTIKIADFGMSRSLYSSHYYRIQGRAILPIRWMANECFYGRFTEKTDVWAFGVSMWEVFMLAKVQPYDELTDQQVIENAVNTEKVKLLQRPEHCPEEVYEVMLQCWEKDPEIRIDFEDVYSSLAALHSYSDL